MELTLRMNHHKMKSIIIPAVCSLMLCGTVLGDPLDRSQISSEAKWLIHLDLDALRKTQFGSAFFKKIQEDHLDKIQNDLVRDLGIKFNFNTLMSATAYGNKFDTEPDKQGVLMIRTRDPLKPVIDGLIALHDGESNEEFDLVKTTEDQADFYSLNQEIQATFPQDNLLVMGKSRANIKQALRVIQGREKCLAGSDGFGGYPTLDPVFFFLGVAESFANNVNIPANAKFLRQAEGGRVALGENDGQLYLNLALKTADAQTTTQIRQVIDGMLALLRLSQQDEDLTRLLNSTMVTSGSNLVSVNVKLPSQLVLDKLDDVDKRHRQEQK